MGRVHFFKNKGGSPLKNEPVPFLVVPLLIILFAFIPRYAYLNQIESSDPAFYYLLPGADPLTFHGWANNLLQGDISGNDKLLYTSFLSFIYRWADNDLYALRLVQVVLGSLVPLLLYFTGKLLFPRKPVGIIAAGLAVFYAPFIFYEGTILIATLQVFLMALLMLFLSLAWLRVRLVYWLAAGLVLGLMSIDRGNVLFAVPFLLVGMIGLFRRRKNKGWLYLTLFILGIVLVMGGVRFLHFSFTGTVKMAANPFGTHLYRGNACGASGSYSSLSDLPAVPNGRSYVTATLKNIRAYPGAWIRLIGRKLSFLLNRYEIPNNYGFEYVRNYYPILNRFLHFGWVLPLGLAGLVMAFSTRHLRLLWFLTSAYGLSILIFFVISRYRLPLVPLLMMFAAYFLVHAGKWFKEKKKDLRVVGVLFLIGLFWMANRDLRLSYPNVPCNLGGVCLKSGSLSEAAVHFREAIRLYPGYAKAYNGLGNAYLLMGMVEEAISAYGKAAILKPERAAYHNNLGVAYFEKGNLDAAVREYERALVLDSEYAKPYYGLGNIYLRLGMEEKAEEMFKKAGDLSDN